MRNQRPPQTQLTEEGGIVLNTLPYPLCKWLSDQAELAPLLATYDTHRHAYVVELNDLEILLHAGGYHLGRLEN